MFNTKILAADRRYPTGSANPAAFGAVIATAPARLFSLAGYNAGAAQNIQLFDLAAMPADGTTCLLNLPVEGDSAFYFDWEYGLPLFAGIVVSNSTTAVTKTEGAADCQFICAYRLKP